MTYCSPNQTAVEALVFVKREGVFHWVLVYPEKAAQDGGKNRTVPGGKIKQLSSKTFEEPRVAMERELREETGITILRGMALVFSALGQPIEYSTAKHESKCVRGFLVVVKDQVMAPQLPHEVRAIETYAPDDWEDALWQLNPGKRQLVEELFRRAQQCHGVPTKLRKLLHTFNLQVMQQRRQQFTHTVGQNVSP